MTVPIAVDSKEFRSTMPGEITEMFKNREKRFSQGCAGRMSEAAVSVTVAIID